MRTLFPLTIMRPYLSDILHDICDKPATQNCFPLTVHARGAETLEKIAQLEFHNLLIMHSQMG